jgi:hypothetical protein
VWCQNEINLPSSEALRSSSKVRNDQPLLALWLQMESNSLLIPAQPTDKGGLACKSNAE